MDKQQQAEVTEETYKLKLEQDEETENMRKVKIHILVKKLRI